MPRRAFTPARTKQIAPDEMMPCVKYGPTFDHRLACGRRHDGPRIQVRGRWLSPLWASRILYVSKSRRPPAIEQVRYRRMLKLDRIAERAGLARDYLPF